MGIRHDIQPMMAAILERISQGESLRSVCRSEGMPAIGTVMKWIANHSHLQEQYARAREAGLDAMAEEILEIADDARNDWMQRNDPNNEGWQFNGEHSQRSKLRIESRKWLLAKMAPKKYGERVTIDAVGPGSVEQLPTAELEQIVQRSRTLELESDGQVTDPGG